MEHIKIAYIVDVEMYHGTVVDWASAWTNQQYGSDLEPKKTVIACVDGEFKELEVSIEHLYSTGTDYMYYAVRLRDPKTKHQFDSCECRLDGRV